VWSNLSFAMVDNLIRGPELSNMIVTINRANRELLLLFENWLTLPSEASSNWTGDSRTDATKQNDDESRGVARGYQIKSRMGAARGNTPVFGGSNGVRAGDTVRHVTALRMNNVQRTRLG
jgi:hypothetical protein